MKKPFYKYLSSFLQHAYCFHLKMFLKVGKTVSKTNKSLLIPYILGIFMATCVEEEPPKGGAEDKKPPMLVEKLCNPNNSDKQINFKGKKLIFVFDKDIKINNFYEEIKIVPSIKEISKMAKKKVLKTLTYVDKNSYEIDKKESHNKEVNGLKKGKNNKKSRLNADIKTKKEIQSQKERYGYTYRLCGNRKIVLRLKNTLNKDTVYVVHFGKAVSSKYGDITNENLSVTFTTGSKISNLSVKGKVVNIMSGEGIKNIYVALYKSSRKQNVLNSSPDYFTKTDNQGNYEIKYIKSSKYLLMTSNAISFEGMSKKLGIHTLGFISKLIDVNTKMDKSIKYKIHAVKRYLAPLEIEKTEVKDGTYILTFNKPIKDYKIYLERDSSHYMTYSILSEDKRCVTVFNWFKNNMGETLQQLEENRKIPARIMITDNDNSVLNENIELAFGKDFAALEDFKLKFGPNNNYIGKNGKVKIEMNIPFKELDLTKAYFKDSKGNKLYFDSKNIAKIDKKLFHNGSNISYNAMHNVITLKRPLLENEDQKEEDILPITLYDLILEKGFVTTIDNQKSDNLSKKYILETNKSTGTIHGSLNLGIPNYKIQLLNKEFEVLQEIRRTNFNNVPYMFKNVPPGEYSIVAIELNNKGEWFAGDIDTLTSPGAVYLYHDKNDFVKIGPGMKIKLKTMYIKISDAS